MHLALEIDEIQRLIFKHLEPRDLAQLAQCCKAFVQNATDESWVTITSFSRILACLPPNYQSRWTKLKIEDLHRFELYVPKVRNLFLEGGYHTHNNRRNWGRNPHQRGPGIRPVDLRSALAMFLPLLQLTVLRLTVAPNFLDVLDLNLYQSITDGIPALEQLTLGHSEFSEGDATYGPGVSSEKIPLHHLCGFL